MWRSFTIESGGKQMMDPAPKDPNSRPARDEGPIAPHDRIRAHDQRTASPHISKPMLRTRRAAVRGTGSSRVNIDGTLPLGDLAFDPVRRAVSPVAPVPSGR